ncbi:hypothetical protein SCB49_12029 [unidentified eubacterium SCB49]|nr:hypothetical protein SCB49_12029 [unidentified eubacterium SCB49]
MKQYLTIIIVLFVSFTSTAQDVFGKWKTIDDNSGEAKSIIEIYEREGKVYGKILKIMNKNIQEARCTECTGEDKDQLLIGFELIRGLKKKGDVYEGGKIIDPENGKDYKCYIELEDDDVLKIRGYIGFAIIGRTQYWNRVVEL